MNWYKKAKVEIHPFSEEGDSFDESSDYPEAQDVYNGVEEAFKKSNINILRNKNITQVATKNGIVIGGVVSSWYQNNNDYGQPVSIFDFDVAVNPEFRGNDLAGIKLIEAAIKQYKEEQEVYSNDNPTMIRVWVVNRRLIPIMERKFGFEIEGDHGSGGAHMVKY
jgi:GNAT superfamily N-acetyltransferase